MTNNGVNPILEPNDDSVGSDWNPCHHANVASSLVQCLMGVRTGATRSWAKTVNPARLRDILHFSGVVRGDLLSGLANLSFEHEPGRDAIQGLVHIVACLANELADLEVDCMRQLAESGNHEGVL